jgi:hypothetical protein
MLSAVSWIPSDAYSRYWRSGFSPHVDKIVGLGAEIVEFHAVYPCPVYSLPDIMIISAVGFVGRKKVSALELALNGLHHSATYPTVFWGTVPRLTWRRLHRI